MGVNKNKVAEENPTLPKTEKVVKVKKEDNTKVTAVEVVQKPIKSKKIKKKVESQSDSTPEQTTIVVSKEEKQKMKEELKDLKKTYKVSKEISRKAKKKFKKATKKKDAEKIAAAEKFYLETLAIKIEYKNTLKTLKANIKNLGLS